MPRIGFGFQVSVLGEESSCSVSSQAVTRVIAVPLRGLTQDVGVQQPGHNLDWKYSRRRAGRSSMGTGQALSTFNQFGFDAMRRHMKASSSGSKSTTKWSQVWQARRRAQSTGASNRELQSWWDIPTTDQECQPGRVSRAARKLRIQNSDFDSLKVAARQGRRRKEDLK